MIFVTDKGRLANNIYQYGHLYAWGREHGRSTMSMRFAYKYPGFRIAHTRYHNAAMYLLGKLAAKLHVMPTVDFSDGQTDAKILFMEQHQHLLVTGWGARFHHLFLKYKEEIIQLFDFMPVVRQQVAQRLQKSTTDSIKLGVHIRRGDYKTWMDGRFYYNDEQFLCVIRQFVNLHPNKKIDVYVCSNDPHLDRTYFCQQLPFVRFFFPNGTPTEDLCLLSECDYIIGPLSSFTLVASMYHNTPLFWMMGKLSPLSLESFRPFDYQTLHFDECFFDPQPSNTK